MNINDVEESFEIIFHPDKYVIPPDIDKTSLLPDVPGDIILQYLPIKFARTLAAGEAVKTVLEIALDNTKSQIAFEPGDSVRIFPPNNGNEVDRLLCRLDMQTFSDSEFQIIPSNSVPFPKHIPLRGSLRCTFLHFVDIRRVLSKKIIGGLVKYAHDKEEREFINKIYKERAIYSEFVLNVNLSILQFLEKFPSCKPSVQFLFENLPRITPRPYSICNSPNVDSTIIKICFSIVKIENDKKGLTTGWFETITKDISKYNAVSLEEKFHSTCSIGPSNEKIAVPLYYQQSSFRLPIDQQRSILMICNGTGISPYIGFLEDVIELKKINSDINYTISLYYGCRYFEKDFLYKDEVDKAIKNKILTKLVTAHSREPESACKYVQDCLNFDEEHIMNVMKNKPKIYVSGSNPMTKEVELFFKNVFMKRDNITDADTKTIIKQLKKDKDYMVEIWE